MDKFEDNKCSNDIDFKKYFLNKFTKKVTIFYPI